MSRDMCDVLHGVWAEACVMYFMVYGQRHV